MIGALTGLVQGRFPVAAKATYADDRWSGWRPGGCGLRMRRSRSIRIRPRGDVDLREAGVAGDRGERWEGRQARAERQLGRYLELQDSTGNVYTYANLGSIPRSYPVPKPVRVTAAEIATALAPRAPAAGARGQRGAVGAGVGGVQQPPRRWTRHHAASAGGANRSEAGWRSGVCRVTATSAPGAGSSGGRRGLRRRKERLFADPSRPASYAAGGNLQLRSSAAQIESFQNYFSDVLHLPKSQYTLKPCGSIVVAGTILGRVAGPRSTTASHLLFMFQPAGKDAPQIDPKPILDGWKLLEATACTGRRGSTRSTSGEEPDDRAGPADEKAAADEPDPVRPARPDLRVRTAATSRPD